ncbi:MAG: acetate kinase, partial [Marinicaulis sp.]|nr:acetate kinase [Marinicaulis sp.]
MENIVTLNAGSSSIKFAVFDVKDSEVERDPAIRGQLLGLDGEPVLSVFEMKNGKLREAVRANGVRDLDSAWPFVLGWIEDALSDSTVLAVGHRVVHGGAEYSSPVLFNDEVMSALQELITLAPGHQPYNLAGVSAASEKWPQAKQIACFDTAFHRTQPRVEQIFALPRQFADEGVIRYGFHGLSYEYIAQTAPQNMEEIPCGKIIVAHLGAGASMCAIKGGKSIATTMGFT